MDLDFENLHVVVSGGTGALGSAVVARLVDAGATCHIPCFDTHEIAGFTLRDHPNVRIDENIDLTNETAVESFYGSLPALWASIHCAGGFDMAPIEATSATAYDKLMTMNARSAFLCCREASKIMQREKKGGRIVNVASRPALEPRTGVGTVAYTMSKAAVAALTLASGEELAPHGIWVNAIAPSMIDTPANRAAMPDADPSGWAKTSDIAETVVFLASTANRTTRSCVVPTFGST